MARWLTPAILLLAFSACEPGGPPPADREVAAISKERAQALFQHKCAICHGESGDGHGPRRRSLFAKPPDFRAPDWRGDRSLAEIRALIRNGKPGSDMPAWKGLDAEEIAGLAEYVASLSSSGTEG